MKYKKDIQPYYLKVDLMNYGSDSTLSTVDTYTFFKDKYVVGMPVRYARKSYYRAFGDQYLSYEIDGYYVKGERLISVIMTKVFHFGKIGLTTKV